MTVSAIISGGQTGADRGALDAAFDLGIVSGGWAPKGWRSEDGTIPESYRLVMREAGSESYRTRTEYNVRDSDGTMILSFGELTVDSGSMLTAKIARHRYGKPHRHVIIPIDGKIAGVALERVREWLRDKDIQVLNVAGPRESREPGLQHAARRAIVIILGDMP